MVPEAQIALETENMKGGVSLKKKKKDMVPLLAN